MKKKGFTLIELIAAIAIFAIAITAISLAFSTSMSTWKRGNVKIDTMYAAQSIIETFKAAGKSNIDNLTVGNLNQTSCFAYFDKDLNNFTLYLNGITSINNNGSTFTDWFNNGPAISIDISGDKNIDNIFSLCDSYYKSKNLNKKFGSYIMIRKDYSVGDAQSNIEGYYIKVIVWDMQHDDVSGSRSVMETYIGR